MNPTYSLLLHCCSYVGTSCIRVLVVLVIISSVVRSFSKMHCYHPQLPSEALASSFVCFEFRRPKGTKTTPGWKNISRNTPSHCCFLVIQPYVCGPASSADTEGNVPSRLSHPVRVCGLYYCAYIISGACLWPVLWLYYYE